MVHRVYSSKRALVLSLLVEKQVLFPEINDMRWNIKVKCLSVIERQRK